MDERKKKILHTVVVVTAMLLALLLYVIAAWQDAGRPPVDEVVGSTLAQDEAGEDAPDRVIDWEALPPEVVAWVEARALTAFTE